MERFEDPSLRKPGSPSIYIYICIYLPLNISYPALAMCGLRVQQLRVCLGAELSGWKAWHAHRLASYKVLGKMPKMSVPQCPPPENKDDDSTFFGDADRLSR